MARNIPLAKKPEPILDSAPYEAPEEVTPAALPWTGPKWEYQLVRTGGNQMSIFNEAGDKGWEAVNSEGGFTLFKRQKIG